MNPILPREMLWTDFKAMHQFYSLDAVNEPFADTLKSVRTQMMNIDSNRVKVFNELYYQMTRIVYERPAPRDLQKYESDIRGNLGWSLGVEIVMSMLYHMNLLMADRNQRLNRFVALTIEERYNKSPYWKPFKECYQSIKRKCVLKYQFLPCPVSPETLADNYVNWQEITRNYDSGAIFEILSLWIKEDDRRMLVEMIKSSIDFHTPKLQKTYYNQVSSVLKTSLFGKGFNQKESSELEKRLNELDQKVMMLEKENAAYRNHTKELEADNERLKAQLESSKTDGSARKFTMVEIVGYGKDCLDNDAWSIVHMLNKLLRGVGTVEDYRLVDELEDGLKHHEKGNIFNNANVTMQSPQIQDVYRISGNNTVNLGEQRNGEE